MLSWHAQVPLATDQLSRLPFCNSLTHLIVKTDRMVCSGSRCCPHRVTLYVLSAPPVGVIQAACILHKIGKLGGSSQGKLCCCQMRIGYCSLHHLQFRQYSQRALLQPWMNIDIGSACPLKVACVSPRSVCWRSCPASVHCAR